MGRPKSIGGGAEGGEKPVLPRHILAQLREGEVVFWSTGKQYRTKGREGKWIAEVRRRQVDGSQKDFPVRGFDLPQDALAYVRSTRAGGAADAATRREPTVGDVYEQWRKHAWKRVSETTRSQKERRWRLYISERWAHYRLSEVRRADAQEWISGLEEEALAGTLGCGIATLVEVRIDAHSLFDYAIRQELTDRSNPFAGLDTVPRPKRRMVTIESQHWSAICWSAEALATPYGASGHRFAEPWIVDMMELSLFTGLREGELLALDWKRIDFVNNAILVHRALRRNAQEIEERTGLPTGPVKRLAVNLPKANKTREVPMSSHARSILERLDGQRADHLNASSRDFVFPSETGGFREDRNLRRAWDNLRKHLDLLAKGEAVRWHRLNAIMEEMRERDIALPTYWDLVDWRDLRNSFASYMRQVRIPDGERSVYMGHGARTVTEAFYERVTTAAFAAAVHALSEG